MSMLEIHADALCGVTPTYHEFLLRYKATAKIVYAVVEGKQDPMLYRGLVERFLPEQWEVALVPAGRKDDVLRTMEVFDWKRFSRKRICFFVDRDLSSFVGKAAIAVENLYITDNYSIENDVVSLGVFRRFLIEVLNVNGLQPIEQEMLDGRFLSALSIFQEVMVPIMAQIILWQREGMNPCLKNINPKDFFLLGGGDIKLKSEFESVRPRLEHVGMCVGLQPADQLKLSEVEAEFRRGFGLERFVRGKYLLWFFVEFALEVHRSIAMLIKRFATSPKMRINVGHANAMILLAPRVRCPESLHAFFERTFGQHVREG